MREGGREVGGEEDDAGIFNESHAQSCLSSLPNQNRQHFIVWQTEREEETERDRQTDRQIDG